MPYIEWRGKKCRVKWDSGRRRDDGKPVYDQKSGFTDEVEAYDYGLDRESDVRNNRYIPRQGGQILTKDYCRIWLESLDVGHRRERAVRSMTRLYIIPEWGDTPVGDITTRAYLRWLKRLSGLPNVGAGYRKEILSVFSMIIDDAINIDKLIGESPIPRKSRRGKFKKKHREKKLEMRIEDVEQLALNANAWWGPAGFAFIWTMACTGMRPAEIYALRREYCHPYWPSSDPNHDQRIASIRRYAGDAPMPAIRVQYQHQMKDGVLQLFPPKYESYRTLVIPKFLADLLEQLLKCHDEELVFLSIKNSPLAKANFAYDYWRKIADGHPATLPRRGAWRHVPEIPPVEAYKGKRLYLLRHGHKEWIDEDGHSRVAAESRMGHELPGVEGVYSNVTPAMERRIMEALQARWETLHGTSEGKFPNPLPVPPQ